MSLINSTSTNCGASLSQNPSKTAKGLSTGAGITESIEIGDSYVDIEILPQRLVLIHDVFVDSSERRQGMGTKLVQQVLMKYPTHIHWTAASSTGMNRICAKLGFQLVRPKNAQGTTVPSGVDYSNADVFRRNPQ